jgi:hypothetical protein
VDGWGVDLTHTYTQTYIQHTTDRVVGEVDGVGEEGEGREARGREQGVHPAAWFVGVYMPGVRWCGRACMCMLYVRDRSKGAKSVTEFAPNDSLGALVRVCIQWRVPWRLKQRKETAATPRAQAGRPRDAMATCCFCDFVGG